MDKGVTINRPPRDGRMAFVRSPDNISVELLQKGLAEVGNFWYEGEVSVQREHFASALSVQRLEILIAASPAPTRPERIVVATAPGDYHIFSPLLLTYMLRQSGWDVIYLGANVPANELASTIEHVQPDLIIVAAQLLHTAATMKEMAIVSSTHGVPLAFGGLVFNQMPELRGLIPGYFLGESMVEAAAPAALPVAGAIRDIPASVEAVSGASRYD